MNEKMREFIKQNAGYVIVAFVCVVYVMASFVVIDDTGKSIAQIFASGAIAFALGFFISTMLGLQGMMLGDRDERVKTAAEEHEKLVLRISPSIELLDEWCEKENKENYKLQRTKILSRVGLKYSDCFDEDGVCIDWSPSAEKLKNKLTRRNELVKLKAYKKAARLKLTELHSGDLTSEGGKQDDPFYFGRTKKQYETQSGVRGLVSKIGTALIFGMYGVNLVESFSYAELIWMSLQVAIFLITGMIKLYNDYNYVINEFRGRIIKKTDNLQKFENYVRSGGKKDE